MNINKAVILKANSDKETKMAKLNRNVFNQNGVDVVIVPHGVTELFITIDEKSNELIVMLQKTNNGYNPEDLDIVRGFNTVGECWQYARLVMDRAGLPEDSCDTDILVLD